LNVIKPTFLSILAKKGTKNEKKKQKTKKQFT
jgi:hypothetical protein